jgi:hypothetical protein
MSNASASLRNTDADHTDRPRRLSTETKVSTKTTELIAYVLAVLAVAITAIVVGNGDEGGRSSDPFSANDALRYITYLTIGYMIARGLAKSGSRDNYDA